MPLCLHPKLSIGIPFSVNAIKIFFPPKRGGLFRILFGIEQPAEYLNRGSEGAQKSESAGVAAHRLEKPPIVDQMHVILWVIKAVDIRFQLGQYREKIKFVQDQLRKASE